MMKAEEPALPSISSLWALTFFEMEPKNVKTSSHSVSDILEYMSQFLVSTVDHILEVLAPWEGNVCKFKTWPFNIT